MNVFLPLMAAAGLFLIFSGIAASVKSASISDRSAPFLRHLTSARVPSGLLEGGESWKRFLVQSQPARRSLSRRLESAGNGMGPEAFRIRQLIWASGGASIATGLALALEILATGFDLRALPIFAGLFGIGGFFLPEHLLGRAIEQRRRGLKSDLPVVIDLLTLSIMAGESVLGAFARVAALTSGVASVESGRLVAEARAGSTAVEALEAFARRADCPPVARLVDALCVAIERGAPVADVLRAQADDIRVDERRDLMELAGRREILMLIPVVFLVLPVVVLFVFYPAVVSLDLFVP